MSSKKNKKKKKKRTQSTADSHTGRVPTAHYSPAEDRAAEAMTVAWMLSAIATGLGALTAGALWVIIESTQNEPDNQLRILPLMLVFAAQVSSVVALILTPAVHWLRKKRPPRLITCGVLMVIAITWLVAMSMPAANAVN